MFSTRLRSPYATLFFAWVFAMALPSCQSPYYADRGALVGGVTGAGLGALVGEAAANEPLAGAAIGTAVGVVTGATIGSGLDEVAAQNSAAVQQAAYRAVTLQDVVQMSAGGLSDDVIISHVHSNGLTARPTAADLVGLRQAGVSNEVIRALQAPPAPLIVTPPPIYGHPPVIYSAHHYAPLCPPLHGPIRHSPRKHVHWGLSFGN
jgi:hypothetical protein